jgi:hypothetical protein
MEVRAVSSVVAAIILVVALGSSSWAATGDAQLGLAAKYPGDAGVAQDPAVIYATGYEDESWRRGSSRG